MLTGRQCRAARALLGWSQTDLAEACGLSKTAINNFEAGTSSIKQASEKAITEAFDRNAIELTDDEGVRPKKDSVRILRGDKILIPLWQDITETLKDTGGEVLILNVDEEKGKRQYNDSLNQYISKLEKLNITERMIARKSQSHFPAPKEWYRLVEDDLLNYGSVIFVYGPKVAIMLWNEEILLIIDSIDAAQAEAQRFEALWHIGKELK